MTKTGVETQLYTFTGDANGGSVNAGLVNLGGVLYGVTSYGGGSPGEGTIFSITTAGAESTLYDFGSIASDGEYPYAPLVNVGGVLYGTTEGGGAHGEGTVYKFTGGVETPVYSFAGGTTDGAIPYASLLNVNGTMYGTTTEGGIGSIGDGTVFSVTKAGKEKVLHFFAGSSSDGQDPRAPLINVGGTLYGTTKLGGANFGAGTVYSIVP